MRRKGLNVWASQTVTPSLHVKRDSVLAGAGSGLDVYTARPGAALATPGSLCQRQGIA